nr:hypothetical protein [Crepidula fornicata]
MGSSGQETVTLRAINGLKKPTFDITTTVQCQASTTLLDIMQLAADQDTQFRFIVKYFDKTLGYYVLGINGAVCDYDQDKMFWQILDGNGEPTTVGVSSYIPWDGETVTFKIVQDQEGQQEGQCPA